mmetsp:Transcript_48984/g.140307  ORF Transcript_48984/g.140307 Transcript_48984/m.140307 type:complete len:140 (-) Transcript_48984:117-536(-)
MSKSDVLSDLRQALEKKNAEKWCEAMIRSEREGYDNDQIAEALEETIKEDPMGCYRFMEDISRPPQAMAVLNMPDDCDEWEPQVRYPDAVFKGTFNAIWSVYPRLPHEDPWADGVDKAHAEVINTGGVCCTVSGMASRY